MKNNKTFKIGDKIVDFGQLYRIFKIKKQSGAKDRKGEIIFFRPYLKTRKNRTLIRSIPVNNIDRTNIRRPIAKKELRRLLRELSKKSDKKPPININKTMGELSLNDPYINVEIVKSLWKEKNDESMNFSKSREDIFSLALNRLVEETTFVNGISLIQARKKIETALEKGIKNDKQNKT